MISYTASFAGVFVEFAPTIIPQKCRKFNRKTTREIV